MNREQAIEAGVRAVHADECCPDWPSTYCDGPSRRDRQRVALVLDAVGWRPVPDVETIAATLALAYGSHVSPPRGGCDWKAAEAVRALLDGAE